MSKDDIKYDSGINGLPNYTVMDEDAKDISGYSTKNDMRFTKVIRELKNLYLKKNMDYGNSFEDGIEEDGILVAKIRLNDKLRRFGRLINHKSEITEESLRDTLVDLANYAIMTIMWLDSKDESNEQKSE